MKVFCIILSFLIITIFMNSFIFTKTSIQTLSIEEWDDVEEKWIVIDCTNTFNECLSKSDKIYLAQLDIICQSLNLLKKNSQSLVLATSDHFLNIELYCKNGKLLANNLYNDRYVN